MFKFLFLRVVFQCLISVIDIDLLCSDLNLYLNCAFFLYFHYQ